MIKKCVTAVRGVFSTTRARRLERLNRAKEQQEIMENSADCVCRFMVEGYFDNADKVIRNIRLSNKNVKDIAKTAMVSAIRNKRYAMMEKIIARYGIDPKDVHDAAVRAWEGSMHDKYYPDAMDIAKRFGLDKEEYGIEPAVMLMSRYMRLGLKSEAKEVASENGLENEFERMYGKGQFE